jgi:hypothetical protein
MFGNAGLRSTAVTLTALAFLAACAGNTPAATPSHSASAVATPTGTETPTGTRGASTPPTSAGAGRGCAANGGSVPRGAARSTYADVDGDHKPDTLFLDATNHRVGIRTASGRVFSREYKLAEASDLSAQAFVTRDGAALILLSGSRKAYLFGVVDCTVVITRNAQGAQYAFDNGFQNSDAGVGCLSDKTKSLTLAGLRAAKLGMSSNYYEIYRTAIVIGGHGRSASNGPITESDRNLSHATAQAKVRTGFPCAPKDTIVKA